MVNVRWQDAVAFTEWLSKNTARTVRLPSEAQWEYAARAGTSTHYWWGNKLETNMANCNECGSQWDRKMTAPVGSFRANPWGLHDMTGNVEEWLADTAHENYENAPATAEPWLGGDAEQHPLRGGAYSTSSRHLKSYFRNWYYGSKPMRATGFRVAIVE